MIVTTKQFPAGRWIERAAGPLPTPRPYYTQGTDYLSVTVDRSDRERMDICLDRADIEELLYQAQKAGLLPTLYDYERVVAAIEPPPDDPRL